MIARASLRLALGLALGFLPALACSSSKPAAIPSPPALGSAEPASSAPGGPEAGSAPLATAYKCTNVCRVTEITAEVQAALEAKPEKDVIVIEFPSKATQEQFKTIERLGWVRKLRLKGVGITDLSPLAAMKDLESLDLVNTGVVTLKPIAGLPKLKSVYFTSGASLVEPWPGKPLAGAKEQAEKTAQAEPGGMQIEGVDPEDFDQLLPKTNNYEPDLSALTQLSALRELRLAGIKLPASVMKGLTQVESLDLYRMKLDDPGALAAMSGLQELILRKVPVASYDFLKSLPKLEFLEIAQARLTDMSFAPNVKRLRRLIVTENPNLSSIAPLKGADTLESLDIDDTAVTDLAPIAALPRLDFIDLQGTPVKSLAPIAKLPALRVINLRRTQVKDLSPLATCPALTHVHTPDGLPKEQGAALLKAKPELHVLAY